jgi:1,4-dihydroxy-2-naphthoate polyprenyltransferase
MSKSIDAAALPGEPSAAAYVDRPLRRYLDATRPPFLSVTVVAVLIGLCSSLYDGVSITWWVFLLAGIGALLAHAGSNVLNDYYDELNGTDPVNTARLFPFTGGSRFIQNGILTPRQMALWGGVLMLGTMLIGLVLLTRGGLPLLWLGALGLILAWAYSAPPLALNSRGLGELVVAIGFGLMIPVGVDLVLRESLASLPLFAGASYALLVAGILYLNQFPDLEADRQAGKRHWVVRLGAQRGRWLYPVLVLSAYGLLAFGVTAGPLPAWALLGLLPLPASLAASAILVRHASAPPGLLPAIRLTLTAAMSHGVLVAAGLWLGSRAVA